MVLYDATNVKETLGETGATNDKKIKQYGTMADNYIQGYLVNVKNLPNPPVVTTDVLTLVELNQIKSYATQLTVAYFYKFESGDQLVAEQTERDWNTWFTSKFKRPAWKVRGGETAR